MKKILYEIVVCVERFATDKERTLFELDMNTVCSLSHRTHTHIHILINASLEFKQRKNLQKATNFSFVPHSYSRLAMFNVPRTHTVNSHTYRINKYIF